MNELLAQIYSFFKPQKPSPELHPIYVTEHQLWRDVRENKVRTIKDNLAAGIFKVDDELVPGTGRSLVHHSIVHNKVELLTLAFLHNADVNKQSVEGTTPLHIACSLNRKHMVQLLLEKGARMDFVDQDGYTPYQRAVYYSKYDIVEYLTENGYAPQTNE